MPLTQIVYVSRRTAEFPPSELADVILASAQRNSLLGVTGALLCLGEHVFQLLEGELTTITTLYERISRDPRHTNVQLLLCKSVARRLYPEWNIKLADFDCRTPLDRARLLALVNDIRATCDTAQHSVEARVLLNDFKQQLLEAA